MIYGDTDSTFVWLKSAHSEADAAAIGQRLVAHVNAWWQQHLQQQFGLDSALELEFETHFGRFLMPTIRGAEQGSKKRYAGLIRTRRRRRTDGVQGAGNGAHRLDAAGAAVPADALSAHLHAMSRIRTTCARR